MNLLVTWNGEGQTNLLMHDYLHLLFFFSDLAYLYQSMTAKVPSRHGQTDVTVNLKCQYGVTGWLSG